MGGKGNLNKFQSIDILQSKLLDHSDTKLELKNKKITVKFPYV